MLVQPWLLFAFLSAVCAALVAIFAKPGMQGVNPTLATAVRSIVMTVALTVLCLTRGLLPHARDLHPRALLMIFLSGLAGAASWLFYFRALQTGEVSQVAPIDKLSMPLAILLAVLLLGDRPSLWNWLGILLIAGGAYLATMPR